MKKLIQIGFILTMIFLTGIAFGQTEEPESKKIIENKKTAKTYLDLMINVVSTNLNYGEANNSLADYQKSSNGIQAGASFQAGITPSFSLVTELYYVRKGGKLEVNNPLTTNESTLRLNAM